MERTFKTPGGKELPITMLPQWKKDKKTDKWIELPPKPYVNVMNRIVWFREEHPDYTISTEILNMGSDNILMKAKILDQDGRLLAEGTKYEDKAGFIDYIEKAESSAIGRALAFLGYGTAYALELEEGEDRLADAPAQEKPKLEETLTKSAEKINKSYHPVPVDPLGIKHKPSIMDLAKFTITFGPNRGKQLQDIDPEQLMHSVDKAKIWMNNNPQHKDLTSVLEFAETAQRYLNFSASIKSDDFNDPKKPLVNHAPEASP